MRLGILGAGNVGDSVAYVALSSGVKYEILLCDINKQRAKSVADDVNDASGFVGGASWCVAAELEDLASCDVIVISTGKIVGNADRLAELEYNKAQMQASIPEIMRAGFGGKFVVISNPCDIISYLVYRLSNLPYSHVIGTGTGLDTARLNIVIAKELGISPKSVNALVLGEHGDSQFGVFSQSFVGGFRLEEFIKARNISLDFNALEDAARQRGREIYIGKKCTQYGIAHTANKILKAISDDSNELICVSTLMQGEYGLSGLYLSTPCIINSLGVAQKLEIDLNQNEKEKLSQSAKILKSKIEQFGI